MRRLRVKAAVGVAMVGAVGVAGAAVAGDHGKLETTLSGFEEVPAIVTDGEGTFRARLSSDEIRFELRYSGLEGGEVRQAHIHIGQEGVNGMISAWLCDSPANESPVATTQVCPASPGTVRGTLTAADIVGPAGQGVAPGEFEDFARAIQAGVAYANVHTATFPAGEIRGQIDDHDHHDGHHGHHGHD
jgi:hypothetical protein